MLPGHCVRDNINNSDNIYTQRNRAKYFCLHIAFLKLSYIKYVYNIVHVYLIITTIIKITVIITITNIIITLKKK